MDQTAMCDAETWLDLAEIMTRTIEDPKIETQAPEAEITSEPESAAETIEPPASELELIEAAPAEPRTARVLSISQLRQKLGIENAAPAPRSTQPATDRPRIIRRHTQQAELLAG